MLTCYPTCSVLHYLAAFAGKRASQNGGSFRLPFRGRTPSHLRVLAFDDEARGLGSLLFLIGSVRTTDPERYEDFREVVLECRAPHQAISLSFISHQRPVGAAQKEVHQSTSNLGRALRHLG